MLCREFRESTRIFDPHALLLIVCKLWISCVLTRRLEPDILKIKLSLKFYLDDYRSSVVFVSAVAVNELEAEPDERRPLLRGNSPDSNLSINSSSDEIRISQNHAWTQPTDRPMRVWYALAGFRFIFLVSTVNTVKMRSLRFSAGRFLLFSCSYCKYRYFFIGAWWCFGVFPTEWHWEFCVQCVSFVDSCYLKCCMCRYW